MAGPGCRVDGLVRRASQAPGNPLQRQRSGRPATQGSTAGSPPPAQPQPRAADTAPSSPATGAPRRKASGCTARPPPSEPAPAERGMGPGHSSEGMPSQKRSDVRPPLRHCQWTTGSWHRASPVPSSRASAVGYRVDAVSGRKHRTTRQRPSAKGAAPGSEIDWRHQPQQWATARAPKHRGRVCSGNTGPNAQPPTSSHVNGKFPQRNRVNDCVRGTLHCGGSYTWPQERSTQRRECWSNHSGWQAKVCGL